MAMSAGGPTTLPGEMVWPEQSPTFHALVSSASASTHADGGEDASGAICRRTGFKAIFSA